MNSFNSKVTNRKTQQSKTGRLTWRCSRRELRGNRTQGLRGTGHNDNDPTRTKGSTETYIHTQGRQGQLDSGQTHEDWCRQSQTGSKERKHTRHRDYKIRQETEHGVKTWTPETTQTDKHRDVQETRGTTNKLKTLIPKGGWKLHTGKCQTVTLTLAWRLGARQAGDHDHKWPVRRELSPPPLASSHWLEESRFAQKL